MNASQTTTKSFSSVEEMDEVLHGMGWSTEYRQLQPGSFSSKFEVLEGESWFLLEEHSSRTVEVQAPAPTGMYAFGLCEGERGTINSRKFTSTHLFLQGPESEFRANLTAGMKVPQVGILAEQFERSISAIAPELYVPTDGANTIAIAPGQAAAIKRAMRAALYEPSRRKAVREEGIASILASLFTALADQGNVPKGRRLHRVSALQALNRAREYIETHLDQTIRIASLCRYSGTSLSTLERTFLREMGLTPQNYVKARRLNAVRNRLLAADRAQDHGVTEIALGYGFTHLGRFAGEYHRFFGEYPRETLNGQ